jgi:hypothetical protein
MKTDEESQVPQTEDIFHLKAPFSKTDGISSTLPSASEKKIG